MRVSEVHKVKQEDIKGNTIFIEDSKNDRDRVVPKPKGWQPYMDSILPLGKSLRTLQRKFTIYAREAGLSKDYSFHSLRHGFATRLLEAGMPINQVQLLLGHSDIATTGIYVLANPKDALQSYDEVF